MPDPPADRGRTRHRHPDHRLAVQHHLRRFRHLPEPLVRLPALLQRRFHQGHQGVRQVVVGLLRRVEIHRLQEVVQCGQQLAVDVALHLVDRVVADPHRPYPAPASEPVQRFLHGGVAVDAVHQPQVPAAAGAGVAQEAQELGRAARRARV